MSRNVSSNPASGQMFARGTSHFLSSLPLVHVRSDTLLTLIGDKNIDADCPMFHYFLEIRKTHRGLAHVHVELLGKAGYASASLLILLWLSPAIL